jgi:hypothetical protein
VDRMCNCVLLYLTIHEVTATLYWVNEQQTEWWRQI